MSYRQNIFQGKKPDEQNAEGMLYKLFKHVYAPFLMKKWVRPAVMVIFYGWFCFSLACTPKIEVGLDQEISMPDDSFVLKYFEYLKVISGIVTRFVTLLC